MMPTRDFTAATKKRLLAVVKEVTVPADAPWYKRFWDWCGDNEPNVVEANDNLKQAYMHGTAIDIQDYHKRIIDQNNTSRQTIEKIWKTVNADNDAYASRLAAVRTDLLSLTRLLKELAGTVSPSNGSFTPAGISRMQDDFSRYQKNEILLNKLADKGLTAQDFGKMDQQGQKSFMDDLLPVWLQSTNLSSAEGSWTIPLGPNLQLTYTVSVTGDKDKPYVSRTISRQKMDILAMKNLKFGKGSLSWDEDGLHADSEGPDVPLQNYPEGTDPQLAGGWTTSSSTSSGTDGTFEKSLSLSNKNTTYTITRGGNIPKQSVHFSYKVSTDLDKTNISSETKIEASVHQSGWGKIPVPASPVPAPFPIMLTMPSIPRITMPEITLPEVDVDPETAQAVTQGVVMTGTVIGFIAILAHYAPYLALVAA